MDKTNEPSITTEPSIPSQPSTPSPESQPEISPETAPFNPELTSQPAAIESTPTQEIQPSPVEQTAIPEPLVEQENPKDENLPATPPQSLAETLDTLKKKRDFPVEEKKVMEGRSFEQGQEMEELLKK